jgi:HEAT repeat protein
VAQSGLLGLGRSKNQAELQALVGALADEDSNIRWLATSFLAQIGGTAVVNMLAAFLQTNPGETARQEAVKVLGLIGDMSEDEGVRAAVRALVNQK